MYLADILPLPAGTVYEEELSVEELSIDGYPCKDTAISYTVPESEGSVYSLEPLYNFDYSISHPSRHRHCHNLKGMYYLKLGMHWILAKYLSLTAVGILIMLRRWLNRTLTVGNSLCFYIVGMVPKSSMQLVGLKKLLGEMHGNDDWWNTRRPLRQSPFLQLEKFTSIINFARLVLKGTRGTGRS